MSTSAALLLAGCLVSTECVLWWLRRMPMMRSPQILIGVALFAPMIDAGRVAVWATKAVLGCVGAFGHSLWQATGRRTTAAPPPPTAPPAPAPAPSTQEYAHYIRQQAPAPPASALFLFEDADGQPYYAPIT